jgi:hypothetical protein
VAIREKSRFALIVNLLLFQAVWFVAVLGAAADNGWIGLVGLTVFLAVHYLSFDSVRADFALAGISIIVGAVAETIIVQSGLMDYKAALPVQGFAPLWLLVLWANLALTANGCLAWLHGRYVLAGVFGATGGPLAYYAGIKLGAATTDSVVLALLVIGLIYAAYTPFMLHLAERFNARYAPR